MEPMPVAAWRTNPNPPGNKPACWPWWVSLISAFNRHLRQSVNQTPHLNQSNKHQAPSQEPSQNQNRIRNQNQLQNNHRSHKLQHQQSLNRSSALQHQNPWRPQSQRLLQRCPLRLISF